MVYRISVLTFVMLIAGCNTKEPVKGKVTVETFDCKNGLMTQAWYTMGQDEDQLNIDGLPKEFIILVDTNQKATNFISFHEEYDREISISLDTSDLMWTEEWNMLTTKQKLKKLQQERTLYKKQADSAHYFNQGQQQVWIINNSKDTVTIQMQDWSFICVLQAKTKSGQWYPIQYWRFSWCGNSYYYKPFPPKTANSFVAKLPDEGDFQTKLRYKLLGHKKY